MRPAWTVPLLMLLVTAGGPWAVAPTTPAMQSAAAVSTSVMAISAGDNNTCAIKTDQTLACWGLNDFGQSTPPAGAFLAVSMSSSYGCAIAADDTIACWGIHTGVDVWAPPAGAFTAVSAGERSACALTTSKTLACWGDNTYGQLDAPSGTFTAVSVGRAHTCAIRIAGGELACWGYDYSGQASPPAGAYVAVAAGFYHACAIGADGALVCWGDDHYGQASPPPGSFTALAAGGLYNCALSTDSSLACWGSNQVGQANPPAGAFQSISAGAAHACATRIDGTFACWGNDQFGEVTPRPTASRATLPTWLSTGAVPLRWSARPALAPVTSYDVRYRRARWNGGFGSLVTWLSATAVKSATFSAWKGYTYCFSVRAHDADGRISLWTSETCTAIPVDDRSLTRSGSWIAGTGTAYYRSTYLRSSSYGARLSRTGVVAKRIALLATLCATCGSVKVYWGSTLLKTISLYSSTTLNRKLITVATFTSARSGTLSIKISSTRKKVIVDGVAIRRN
jgi:hypothetical protein